MSDQPRTRQELYDRIRQSSKDDVILQEMIRLGFWTSTGRPEDPATELERREEIRRELAGLRAENRHLHNEQALKQELLKQRMAESKRKQQENRERREQERQARAAAWQERQTQEIVYLGAGVSSGLHQTDCNVDRLKQYHLPVLDTANAIAAAIGISLSELRFLAFSRRTSTVSHYVRFQIAKKTGGQRLISAPMPRLKQVQQWILDHILERVELHPASHGFRRGRSIITNATPHVAADVVINFDLKDFFPSISYPRVKGIFRSLGYSEAAATILGLICTESEVEEVELDGKTYFVALGDRHLPQGAPSSPAITNLLCRRLDRRLAQMASQLGFTYTRYADDLTFSASGESTRNICNVMKRTRSIVAHEGLEVHEQKTRVLRKSQHQEVTGVVVNKKLNVDRDTLKRFRATLHHIEKDGLAGKRWGSSPDVLAAIEGFAHYVAMVNSEKGEKFLAQVRRIKQRYGPKKRR
jgi:RNA-directed DNA polymerase